MEYSTDNDQLEVVDENDNVVTLMKRSEIHRHGLMHRAVHIFVINKEGEVYVQKRSLSKDRHPRLLDSSAAGHVDPGESYDDAASRELYEELGIRAQVNEILRIKPCIDTDNEHVRLFLANSDDTILLNTEEIEWGSFFSFDEVTRMMGKNPGDFVPAFRLLWKEFVEKSL
jgi:isopentenyldiphosphate isomerase